MHAIGIDLGTTNSVVAVEGHYPEKGQVCENVTVIADEFGRFTQASAVCKAGDEIVVGDDAKDMISEEHTPVRFAKKYMGTQETFRVGDELWTAVQVSAKVLEHMRSMVERALGGTIQNAIVTHPAYFDALAINATKEAAAMIGLNVELMMEPIAAAMAYTYSDRSEHLRVLVYDLGGGTFDVTLVERTSGAFRPVAFGGNRELGGYNFDKSIALKMLASLREKGYRLVIDQNHPERDPRWASLMHHAEQMKIKLSSAPKADLRMPGIFRDDSEPSKSVSMAFSISRAEFLESIKDEINETISATKAVLAKAGCLSNPGAKSENDPNAVHQLVLVGGSSRIPAIQERLTQEFGLTPHFSEDIIDLSVAVGAAIAASQMGKREGQVLLQNIPTGTDRQKLTIAGRVLPSQELSDVANCVVTVRGGLDEETTTTGGNGGFHLEVMLNEESENSLQIVVESPNGEVLLETTRQVKHGEAIAPPPPKPKPPLPKPISVATDRGLKVIAAENVTLPYSNTTAFVTLEELTEVPLDIYQEDMLLSTLAIKGFSSPVPENSRVDLKLEIDDNYNMKVTASVPVASISKTQEIKLQKPVIPNVDEMGVQLKQLEVQYESRLGNMPDGDSKARMAAECDRLIEELKKILGGEQPERIQAFMLLNRFALLVKQISAMGALKPSKSEFEDLLKAIGELLPQAIQKRPEIAQQRLGDTVEILKQQATKAYQEADPGAWGTHTKKVAQIKEELERIVKGGPEPEIPPAPILKMIITEYIDELDQEVAAGQGNLPPNIVERAKSELRTARQKLGACDVTRGKQAQAELIGVLQQHVAAAGKLLNRDSRGSKVGELPT